MEKQKKTSLAQLERQYSRCRERLAQIGQISQGSVQDRTGRIGGGAGYQWTRKASGKTVTVALTREQFQTMKQAIKNQRKLQQIVSQMETISRQIIFQNHPHPARRKRLSNKVLGLN